MWPSCPMGICHQEECDGGEEQEEVEMGEEEEECDGGDEHDYLREEEEGGMWLRRK
ncbi:hypothetical protein LR48_Vigan03g050800 [Vigna angularis]|uniref:Uncharacterized protein n=1 Tax=Phaseolus angularis TaxID=3914 RepID=A0A0L9U383_PHAAN|nr:hypothetical protein LR48_Vigan03g050800 [Vigna angularis]